MMVIQDENGVMYPADRCTWYQATVNPAATPSGNHRVITDSNARTDGYYVTDVRFYSGAVADGTRLSGRNSTDLTATTLVQGGIVTLGVIGKSGRFVAISNQV